MRTRCRAASRRPIGMNGWTSPREPTIMMTMDKGGTWGGPAVARAAASSSAWEASQCGPSEAPEGCPFLTAIRKNCDKLKVELERETPLNVVLADMTATKPARCRGNSQTGRGSQTDHFGPPGPEPHRVQDVQGVEAAP